MSGIRKAIILAGGAGTRLYPVTAVACKQLLPVYDKPLIYYPLATIMHFGIRDILIISTPDDIPRFEALLGNGESLGLDLSYAAQPNPEGIAQAFLIGETFMAGDSVMLVLGDNIFYGLDQYYSLGEAFETGAHIFGYRVNDASRYGVIQFDDKDNPMAIIEKPTRPISSTAVTGLYMYDHSVVEKARALKPSARGELEISEINQAYLDEGALRVEKLARGVAWLDTGTHESMLEAGNFIATIERRQGKKIACIEEIALQKGYIDAAAFQRCVARLPAGNSYRSYLETVLNEHVD